MTDLTEIKATTGSALIPAAARELTAEMMEGLEAYAKTGAPAWFGELLKFNGKTGDWSAGKENLPIEQGRLLVAVLPEMVAGHVLWRDGELVDQSWVPAFQFNPRDHRASLGDQDQDLWPRDEKGNPVDPWKEAVMLPMVDPATREEFTFSSSSVGGVRASKRLSSTYSKQMKATPETTRGCLPIVALSSSSYQHTDKKRGTIYNPAFEGMDWIRASDLLLPPEPGSDSEPPPDDIPEMDFPLAAPSSAGTNAAPTNPNSTKPHRRGKGGAR
jgi:hypothetical protein